MDIITRMCTVRVAYVRELILVLWTQITSYVVKPGKTYITQLQKIYFNKKNLHGLSPRAKYTDRATAACRRSDCQLLRIEGVTWSV
jgi:hypothetical protein